RRLRGEIPFPENLVVTNGEPDTALDRDAGPEQRGCEAGCVGTGGKALEEWDFSACVIDEATQATEPACLIPLTKGIESLLLVGDPMQLPPTVISPEAEGAGLGVSLFERLQRGGLEPHMLAVQYRMHPAICDFPSKQFYNGRLESHPKPYDRMPPKSIQWPDEKRPIMFVDIQEGAEKAGGENTSYSNEHEASVVTEIVMSLLEDGKLRKGDIGIITPYRGQVTMLNSKLEAQGLIRKMQSSGQASAPAKPASFKANVLASNQLETEELEVKTVDGFQGREKEVIIFSTVRSNAQGRVGFLTDQRRLNVALTRARRGLVVVGNSLTLCNDPTWAAWLKVIRQNQLDVMCQIDDDGDDGQVP
ncbi:hypothetical protein CYMTET_22332, partial [Cymbomonas tetramitiformis]